MWIIKNRKLLFSITGVTALLSLTSILVFGFNPGIDFQGGSLLEVTYTQERPATSNIQSVTNDLDLPGSIIQQIDEKGVIIKTAELTDEKKIELTNELSFNEEFPFIEERYKNLGPTISSELKNKSIFAIFLVVIAIVLFIAYTFNGVSRPVSSFRYGLVAIVALIHDILIPTAVFAALGSFLVDYQIDVLFVTALLAILGFSVNDTIVVFDRIRENLKTALDKKKKVTGDAFREIVGRSLEQTFRRSLNTSITTLIPLAFLFFIGGDATKPFALVLAIGVIAGTFSSLFIASPLLTVIEQYQKPPKPKKPKVQPKEFVPRV